MQIRIRPVLGLMIAFCALWCAQVSEAQEMRTWTDSTGKFKLQASYVSHDGSKVTLRLADGKEMKIEIRKLSAADQKYVAKAKDENPFKPADDNPFEAAGEMRRVDDIDLRSARLIGVTSDGWNLTLPQPAEAQSFKSVPLPEKRHFFDGMKQVLVRPEARRALVSRFLSPPVSKREDQSTHLMLCDLENGRIVAQCTAVGPVTPLAIHPDGEQVLVRIPVDRQADQVELWTIKGNGYQPTLAFTPYEKDCVWAEFLDEQRLVSISESGQLVFCDLAAVKPTASFSMAGSTTPALSFDHKWLAFCTGDKVGIIDTDRQEVVAVTDAPGRIHFPRMAFSPSASRLAVGSQQRLMVFDVQNGNLYRDITPEGIHIFTGLSFPDDDFVLGGGKYLIELENQIKLWEYDMGPVDCVGTTMAIGTSNALVIGKMPHKTALDMLAKAKTDPDLFVFREGTRVKLDLNGIPAADRSSVETALTERLRKMNCTVDQARGTITAVASVEGPKAKKVQFIADGTYDVQEYISKLSLNYNGKPAWQTQTTNIPHFVSVPSDDNLANVLKRASEKPNYGFFGSVALPRFVQQPTGDGRASSGQTLGKSSVDSSGLR